MEGNLFTGFGLDGRIILKWIISVTG